MVQDATSRQESPLSVSTPKLDSPFQVIVSTAPEKTDISQSIPSPTTPDGASRPSTEQRYNTTEEIKHIVNEAQTRNEASEKVADLVEQAAKEGRVEPVSKDDVVRSEIAGSDSKILELNLDNLGKMLPANSTSLMLQRMNPDGTPKMDNGKLIQDIIYLDGKGNITGFEIIHEEPPTSAIGPETRAELEQRFGLGVCERKELEKAKSLSHGSDNLDPSRGDSGVKVDGAEVEPLRDITNQPTPPSQSKPGKAQSSPKKASHTTGDENQPPTAGSKPGKPKGLDPAHMAANFENPPYNGNVSNKGKAGSIAPDPTASLQKNRNKQGRGSPQTSRKTSMTDKRM